MMDIIKRIDYVGALLSIGGVTLFLVGLQAGGYQYAWVSYFRSGPCKPAPRQSIIESDKMNHLLTWV